MKRPSFSTVFAWFLLIRRGFVKLILYAWKNVEAQQGHGPATQHLAVSFHSFFHRQWVGETSTTVN